MDSHVIQAVLVEIAKLLNDAKIGKEGKGSLIVKVFGDNIILVVENISLSYQKVLLIYGSLIQGMYDVPAASYKKFMRQATGDISTSSALAALSKRMLPVNFAMMLAFLQSKGREPHLNMYKFRPENPTPNETEFWRLLCKKQIQSGFPWKSAAHMTSLPEEFASLLWPLTLRTMNRFSAYALPGGIAFVVETEGVLHEVRVAVSSAKII